MKANLRKMKDRLDMVADARQPLKPTIVAFRTDEGLLFEGRIYHDFESIHREFPGKYDRDPIGVDLHTVDARLSPEVKP